MKKTVLTNEATPHVKLTASLYEKFVEKICRLEISGDHRSFRRAFKIPLHGFKQKGNQAGNEKRDKWFNGMIENKSDYQEYEKMLDIIVKKYEFDYSDIPLVENYLQTGGEIVVNSDEEHRRVNEGVWKPTREAETLSLVKRIAGKQRKDMTDAKIADYYNAILKQNGLEKKITTSNIQQAMSRGTKKFEPDIDIRTAKSKFFEEDCSKEEYLIALKEALPSIIDKE